MVLLNRSESGSVPFGPKYVAFSHSPLLSDILVARGVFDLFVSPIGSPTYGVSLDFKRVKKLQEIILLLLPIALKN